ncbi:MAG: hypothetical protein KGL95_09665 [Patescibacteria group bacterium]|nr:hypothetical protein [Patescibacteria group bacterium]
MPLRNVRMLVPNSTLAYSYTSNNKQTLFNELKTLQVSTPLANAGFWHMPNVGDFVVVGFLNGYPDLGICHGFLLPTHDPRINLPADPNDTFVGSDGKTYRAGFNRQDAIWYHETGSFIRFRNLAVKRVFRTGINNILEWDYTWDGKTLQPELTIQHASGSGFVMTEDANGKVATTFNQQNEDGTQTIGITFDSSGNATFGSLGNMLIQAVLTSSTVFTDTQGDIYFSDNFKNILKMDSKGFTFESPSVGKFTINSQNITANASVITLGTAAQNAIVLSPFLTNYYNTHTHTDSLGFPTTVPLVPAVLTAPTITTQTTAS